jgi:hypothetical protein
MSSENKLEQWSKDVPKWVVSFIPVLLAIRKRSGWELLWTALCIIPFILALRLVIVILIYIGFVMSERKRVRF